MSGMPTGAWAERLTTAKACASRALRVRQRIFVVGVPRSGTTLLQSLLAAHPEVASFTESHFFSRHFRMWPWPPTPLLIRNPIGHVESFARRNGRRHGPIPGFERGRSHAALATRPLETARAFVRLLDELALERQCPVWVEKTPRHLHRLDLLERATADDLPAQIVHIVRNGRDVSASLYEAARSWGKTWSVRACVSRWNRDLDITLGRLGSPNTHVVVYESLVSDPERTLQALCHELGLAWCPDMVSSYQSAVVRLISPGEHWKSRNGGEIIASSKFQTVLTEAQQRFAATKVVDEKYERILAHVAHGEDRP